MSDWTNKNHRTTTCIDTLVARCLYTDAVSFVARHRGCTFFTRPSVYAKPTEAVTKNSGQILAPRQKFGYNQSLLLPRDSRERITCKHAKCISLRTGSHSEQFARVNWRLANRGFAAKLPARLNNSLSEPVRRLRNATVSRAGYGRFHAHFAFAVHFRSSSYAVYFCSSSTLSAVGISERQKRLNVVFRLKMAPTISSQAYHPGFLCVRVLPAITRNYHKRRCLCQSRNSTLQKLPVGPFT